MNECRICVKTNLYNYKSVSRYNATNSRITTGLFPFWDNVGRIHMRSQSMAVPLLLQQLTKQ